MTTGSNRSGGGNGNGNAAGDGSCKINGNMTGGKWHGDCCRGSSNLRNKSVVDWKVGSRGDNEAVDWNMGNGGDDEAVDQKMGNGGDNEVVDQNLGSGGDDEGIWLVGDKSDKGVKVTVNVATAGLSAGWSEVFSKVLRGPVALYS